MKTPQTISLQGMASVSVLEKPWLLLVASLHSRMRVERRKSLKGAVFLEPSACTTNTPGSMSCLLLTSGSPRFFPNPKGRTVGLSCRPITVSVWAWESEPAWLRLKPWAAIKMKVITAPAYWMLVRI